jgi:hypothetical protein
VQDAVVNVQSDGRPAGSDRLIGLCSCPTGPSPAWHLQKVELQRLEPRGGLLTFVADRWLGGCQGSGECEVQLVPACEEAWQVVVVTGDVVGPGEAMHVSLQLFGSLGTQRGPPALLPRCLQAALRPAGMCSSAFLMPDAP